MTTAIKPKAGLEDIVATSSAICFLDGDQGVLAYCGYDIHDLARHATFEEVCYLLWHRRLPTRADLGARALRRGRRRQLAAGELSQGGAADGADELARRDDGPSERRERGARPG